MNENADKRRPSPHPPGAPLEKRHRLPRESYRGQVNVAFTLCIANRTPFFAEPDVVSAFVSMLRAVTEKHACVVPIYCFMPDHVHLLLSGQKESADAWNAAQTYKQKTGFWLGQHHPGVKWQNDFYDHIIRRDEDLGAQVRYIAGNQIGRASCRERV